MAISLIRWAGCIFALVTQKQRFDFLEQATELEPADSEITGHLGDVYWYLGRRDEARFKWRWQYPWPKQKSRRTNFARASNRIAIIGNRWPASMIPADPIFPASLHAAAKVNLFLHITGRRDDGYHTLESGVCSPHLVTGSPSTAPRQMKFALPVLLPTSSDDGSTNICAACLDGFREAGGAFEPVRSAIEKNIPVGAGLGGGSADAAALLRYLNQHTSRRFHLMRFTGSPFVWGRMCLSV